jgi:hypothetical protein
VGRVRARPDHSCRGAAVMPSLVWNNFLVGLLCIVLLGLALGIYIYTDKQRPHDTAWHLAVAACIISTLISASMLLYDVSIWLYLH